MKSKPKSMSSKVSVHSKRQIFSGAALFLLLTGYAALFFVPSMPAMLLARFGLAFGFALLMGTAFFFLIKKRLTAQDFEYIKDEENFARAVRAMKQTKFYTKKLPGFPKGIRKEILPSVITGFVLFLVMCIVSPCRLPEAPLPDFAKMAAQEFYYPYLFAAGDSFAVLAPPTLARETETWADAIPAKRYLEWAMYANIFKNHFESANADGNLCEKRTAGVSLAMAQASLLAGKYERAVTEYQEAINAGNASPETAFQLAIAQAYAGDLRGAEKGMNALSSKAVAEAIGDEFALPHWKLVLQILQGDLSPDTLQDYSVMYTRQRNALAKFNETAGVSESDGASGSASGRTSEGKVSADGKNGADEKNGADGKVSANGKAGTSGKAPDEAARKAQEKRVRLERRVGSTANNMAVIQILEGDYANACATANAVLSISRNSAARTGKIMRMCTYNTKGFAVGFLGGSVEDKGTAWDPTVYTAPQEYFQQVRKLYEEILAASRLETEAADPGYKKSMYYLLPWVNEAQFALSNDFTSEQLPDVRAFQEKFGELLSLCDGLHKIWSANEVKNVPLWAVSVENFLMRESLIIEGIDKNDNYALSAKICGEFMKKDRPLALVDVRTLATELQLLGRFAAKEALTISMLENLRDEQKKTVKMAKEFLPENHPIQGRLALCSLRLTLIKKTLTKKDFAAVQTSLNRAQEVFEANRLPDTCCLKAEFNAAARLVGALKKKELAEIQAVFTPALEQTRQNLYAQSKVYRDLGFALQHRGFTTDADAANRSARTIFNQQIYRSNTHHFLILQMDKILKH